MKKEGILQRFMQGSEDKAAEDIKGWKRGRSGDGSCNSAAWGVSHSQIYAYFTVWFCTLDTVTNHTLYSFLTKHAHLLTKQHLKMFSFRRTEKEKLSFQTASVFAKIFIHPFFFLIHQPILSPLLSFHSCSQSLFLPMGEWCLVGDYGTVPHLFIQFTSCFGALYSLCVWECGYGMRSSVFVLFMCTCVFVLNPDHSVCLRTLLPQHLTPPCVGIYYPNPHICSCVFAAPCSPPPHFFLFYPWGGTQNKGEKVAQFPPFGSHNPTERRPRSNVLFAHAQHLAPLSDLHMRPK